jgi:hypothetical protein
MTLNPEPQFNETVLFRHDGRNVTGIVTSTAHEGTTLISLGVFSIELGHVNRVDDGILVLASALLTVDLAQLTERMGRPASDQQAVAAFADSSGPWTEDEAAELVHVWQHTDAETGVYTAPAGLGDEPQDMSAHGVREVEQQQPAEGGFLIPETLRAELLAVERITAKMPPQQPTAPPRRWSRLDTAEDMPAVIDVEHHGRWRRCTGVSWRYEPIGGGGDRATLEELRFMGDVIEVLDTP